jgi:hypothetical protein
MNQENSNASDSSSSFVINEPGYLAARSFRQPVESH